MADSMEKRVKELEDRIKELEGFKERAERFFRDFSLRDILHDAGGAVRLTERFGDVSPGHYCKKCFIDGREFYRVEKQAASFQTSVGEALNNAVCHNCGTRTFIGTDQGPFFR